MEAVPIFQTQASPPAAPKLGVSPAMFILLLLLGLGVAGDVGMRLWDRFSPPAVTPAQPVIDFAAMGRQVKAREHAAEAAIYLDASARMSRGDKFSDIMAAAKKAIEDGRAKAFQPVAVALSQIVPDASEPTAAERAEAAKALADYSKGVGAAK